MKTKTTSSAIALPTTIQPPPRKEDIINAIVERARVKHDEEGQKLEKLRKEAVNKFNAAVLEELRKNPSNFTVQVCNYHRPEVQYTMEIVPVAITKLKEAIRQVPSIRGFDAVAVKRQIREGMNSASDRVKALLANPDVVKKLDAALNAITK